MKGSIRQRSPGSWELTVDMGRDARGKRLRKFVTIRGSKSGAQRRLREMLSTLDRGIPLVTERVTVAEWMERWLGEIVAVHRRQTTLERYSGIVNRHIIPVIGHLRLDRLTPLHIRQMESDLTAREMAPAGVQLVHTALSGALKYAMQMEVIFRNPASLVSPPPVRRPELSPPDIAAVRDILLLAEETQHPLFAAIHLTAYTGMRRGEVMGLQWQHIDLDWEEGYVTVSQSLVRSKEKGVMIQPPKTVNGRRIVDLDTRTIEVLRNHRDRQDGIKKTMRDSYVDQGIVFANARGGWLLPDSLSKAVARMGVRAGHEGFSSRILRHFHASVALQEGGNVVVVSKRLGHSKVSITTDIYGHALPGWQRETAAAFAEAMKID